MTPEGYKAAQDELEQKAYQTGIVYARLRKLRMMTPYPAPGIIVEREQRRLDVLADRVSDLLKAVVDYEMARGGE